MSTEEVAIKRIQNAVEELSNALKEAFAQNALKTPFKFRSLQQCINNAVN